MTMRDMEKGKKSRWPEEESAFKSPWVWGLGGLFTVFLAVQFTMVTIAVKTKPDLVTKDFYDRGQSFVERSKMKSKMIEKLGWQMDLAFGKVRKDEPVVFSLSITSKGDTKVADEVVLLAYRPSDAKKDFEKPMSKTAEGVYQAEVTFSEPGYWDVIAVAKNNGKEADLAKRIHVQTD